MFPNNKFFVLFCSKFHFTIYWITKEGRDSSYTQTFKDEDKSAIHLNDLHLEHINDRFKFRAVAELVPQHPF
jgi:hypothetical protein